MLQEVLKEKVVVEDENLQDYGRRIKEEKVKSWKEKVLHGKTVQQTSDVRLDAGKNRGQHSKLN